MPVTVIIGNNRLPIAFKFEFVLPCICPSCIHSTTIPEQLLMPDFLALGYYGKVNQIPALTDFMFN